MNAGAYGGETKDILIEARAVAAHPAGPLLQALEVRRRLVGRDHHGRAGLTGLCALDAVGQVVGQHRAGTGDGLQFQMTAADGLEDALGGDHHLRAGIARRGAALSASALGLVLVSIVGGRGVARDGLELACGLSVAPGLAAWLGLLDGLLAAGGGVIGLGDLDGGGCGSDEGLLEGDDVLATARAADSTWSSSAVAPPTSRPGSPAAAPV